MESNCSVCLGQLKYPLGKPDNCEHKFCYKCISDWLKKRSQCPLCGGAPKFLVKIEENLSETKVPVKKRTATQFENELLVRDQLEEGYNESLNEDITIQYASCRSCRRSDNEHLLLLCDGNVGQNADGSVIRCNVAYHSYCLPEKLKEIPKDDWFCPFCADKPENAQRSAKQAHSNVLPSEADTSSSSLLKHVTRSRQDSTCYPNERSRQDEVKMKITECSSSSVAESVSLIVHGGTESEYAESNYSDENSEYSGSNLGAHDYDDSDYEQIDDNRMTGGSSERTVGDTDAEDVNGSSSSSSSSSKLEYEGTDESDYELDQSMPRRNYMQGRMKCSRRRAANTKEKVTGFLTMMKSKCGKTVTKYQGFTLTRRHST
ncbi:unnamed protein product [Litomosoides sigmodontis]|uniref:RING-type domain-containing protein n=1 Tax=Litomosoides sigmodontis TaxID=42156 RepID=A0A3P6SNG7_LITSI|nr:unnamed protein product [Litomosoides sigmodontis]